MSKYTKAIAAFLGSAVPLLALFGLPLPAALQSPEVISSISVLVATLAVLLSPKNGD